MSENQPTTFYAVAYGNQRGVFTTYKEAQAAMKGFPQPVYKKFPSQGEAEDFLKKNQPESTVFEAKENDEDGKFYAVARGRVIGIFKDHDTVKKNIAGFPKAMHKKFSTYAEAKQYFEQFAEGKVEKKTPKKRAHSGGGEDNAQGVKSVARKRTSGKVGETDDSDGGEQMDQSHSLNDTPDAHETTEGTDAANETETTQGEEEDLNLSPDKGKDVEEGEKQQPAVKENGEGKGDEEEKKADDLNETEPGEIGPEPSDEPASKKTDEEQ